MNSILSTGANGFVINNLVISNQPDLHLSRSNAAAILICSPEQQVLGFSKTPFVQELAQALPRVTHE